ncbi:MAG: DHH family phosphoesterase [Pyramidobacter sp.]
MNPEAEKIAEILGAEPKWLILSHVKPDGDTLGCGSALYCAGVKLGKDVAWGGVDPMPRLYAFLPHADRYRAGGTQPQAGRCVVTVDVSTSSRGVPGMAPRICIDHHRGNEGFASEVNWIVPDAAAVGELIYEVILALGCPIEKDMAEALYVSLTTDSGGFAFSNTTSRTLSVAAELVKAGAVPVEVDEKLHHNDSPSKINLWGRCMSRAKKVGGRAAMSWISRDDFRETGADDSDTEGLVNMLTRMAGTDLTVLVNEAQDCLRCSVRARGDLSALEFAMRHDGGGHRYAAGCKLYVPLAQGVAQMEEELKGV